MAKIDLSRLTRRQLEALQVRIALTLENQRVRDRQAAVKAAELKVREFGFSLSELLDPPKRRSTRSPAKPKYQHPDNPLVTWSGRGRPPRWVRECLERGKDIEVLLIRPQS